MANNIKLSVDYIYDKKGRLAEYSTQDAAVRCVYDAAGNLLCCGQGNTAEQAPPLKTAPVFVDESWQCACGNTNKTEFCTACGRQRPDRNANNAPDKWVCGCGHTNSDAFCAQCGAKRPY